MVLHSLFSGKSLTYKLTYGSHDGNKTTMAKIMGLPVMYGVPDKDEFLCKRYTYLLSRWYIQFSNSTTPCLEHFRYRKKLSINKLYGYKKLWGYLYLRMCVLVVHLNPC